MRTKLLVLRTMLRRKKGMVCGYGKQHEGHQDNLALPSALMPGLRALSCLDTQVAVFSTEIWRPRALDEGRAPTAQRCCMRLLPTRGLARDPADGRPQVTGHPLWLMVCIALPP